MDHTFTTSSFPCFWSGAGTLRKGTWKPASCSNGVRPLQGTSCSYVSYRTYPCCHWCMSVTPPEPPPPPPFPCVCVVPVLWLCCTVSVLCCAVLCWGEKGRNKSSKPWEDEATQHTHNTHTAHTQNSTVYHSTTAHYTTA
jgi:hypothetical protein